MTGSGGDSICTDLHKTQNVHVFSAALRYSYLQYKDRIIAATVWYNLMEIKSQLNQGLAHNHKTKFKKLY